MGDRIVKALIPVLLLLTAGTFRPAFGGVDDPAIHAAGCLIRSGQTLLTVGDIWSRRAGFPAGGRDAGESPARTAVRETLEETGISIGKTEFLRLFGTFALFACEPEQPLPFYTLPDGSRHMPVPLHARGEIFAISLMDASELTAENWRFPAQVEEVRRLVLDQAGSFGFRHCQEDCFTYLENRRHPWLDWQAETALFLQGKGWLDPLMKLANFFGEEKFFFLVMPFLLVGRSRSFAFQLVGVLVLSGVLNGFLKELFAWSRPLDLYPEVGTSPLQGYGFPSGHTQVAATFYAMLGLRYRRYLFPCLVLAALTGMARVYLGAHFVHDVVTAFLLGIALAVLASRYWHWGAVWLLCLLMTFVTMTPESVGMMVFLSVLIPARRWLPESGLVGWLQGVAALVIIAGMFFLPPLVTGLLSREGEFSRMLTNLIVVYGVLAVWMLAGSGLPARLSGLRTPA